MSELQTIMLIDDNIADNFYHKLIIEEAGIECNIIEFESAIEALDYLKSDNHPAISLVLLDINMPRINGFEFLEAYEALDLDHRADMVIVMLTNSLRESDKYEALKFSSVADFLVKPLTDEYLAQLISTHFADK